MDSISQKKNENPVEQKTFKDFLSTKCQVNVEIDYSVNFPTNSNIILNNLDVHNDEINIQAIDNSEKIDQAIILKEKLKSKVVNTVKILTCDQLNNSIDTLNAQNNTKLAVEQTKSSVNNLDGEKTIIQPPINTLNIKNIQLKIHSSSYQQPKAVKRKIEEPNKKENLQEEIKRSTRNLNELVADHNNSIKGTIIQLFS